MNEQEIAAGAREAAKHASKMNLDTQKGWEEMFAYVKKQKDAVCHTPEERSLWDSYFHFSSKEEEAEFRAMAKKILKL